MTVEDLRRAFRGVRGVLERGAPFLFDLNMEEGFRKRWRGSFGLVEDDHVCVVGTHFPESASVGEFLLTIFRQEAGWTRADVSLRQRCYAVDEVTGALSGEGFSNVRVLDAARDLGLSEQVGRSFFLTRA